MKPIGEIEEDLADKTEPIFGFRPSSKIKRGPIGIIMLWIMARWGRNARRDKLQKAKHGRAADLLVALMFFHSFLGFLYIFEVV